MAFRIVAWDDIKNRLIRTDKDPADIVDGALSDIVESNSVALLENTNSVDVVFPRPFDTSGSYVLLLNISNLVSVNPQFQQAIVTTKSATGFTAKWNARLDGANYFLDYIAISPAVSTHGNIVTLTETDEFNINLLSANSYAVCNQIHNYTDVSPTYPTYLIANKDTLGFDLKLNTALDSANYITEWGATNASSSRMKSGVLNIASGTKQNIATFNFPSIGTSNYSAIVRISNDSVPMPQPIVVTGKAVDQFICTWNVPTAHEFNRLEYILSVN